MTVNEFYFLIAIGGVLLLFESVATLLAKWFKWQEAWTKFGMGIGIVIIALIPVWTSLLSN